ncbi:MAG: hypothetical protein K2W92_02665 [Alphaproteobacteria bacterium]|nr:hypothetical protein [Alphaproteobacteria bacterium]
MNEIELLTEQKLNELSELMVKNKASSKLMDSIRSNIKVWDKKLYPLCRTLDLNFIDVVAEILGRGGFEVDKLKLATYLSRARKSKGGRNEQE